MLLNVRQPSVAPAAPKPNGSTLPRVAYALCLDPSQKFGTMEEQIVLLAERFRAEGSLFVPIFICDPDSDASQFRSRGIDAQCLDLERFSLQSLMTLRRFLRSQKIDVVHWNFVAPLMNPYVWWLSLMAPSLRAWFTDHNSRDVLTGRPRGAVRLAKRILLRRYGRVICVSRYVEECLARQEVWSNLVSELHFVNTERFRPDEQERQRIRTELGAGDRFVLVGVGQLIAEKGFHIAVRAMAQLPDHVNLWIIGKGPEAAALKNLIAELGLEDRVKLLGQQRHVQPYYQAADCFLCPSLWAEAAGLVNIEAQACGVPVIASRIGGIPEYVAHGETGLLFTPGEPRELAQCVRRLLDDGDVYSAFASAARNHAVEHFSQNARLDQWLDLYRRWRD